MYQAYWNPCDEFKPSLVKQYEDAVKVIHKVGFTTANDELVSSIMQIQGWRNRGDRGTVPRAPEMPNPSRDLGVPVC